MLSTTGLYLKNIKYTFGDVAFLVKSQAIISHPTKGVLDEVLY